ncbi:gliding motility-associated C-terminal domain-containing protein [Lacinutrix jangbogonensis]|uniref:gliding motility-associated C-terminal domain-containing protein n=1 Tax=Lacinutrix jangbogonensis TaxID=1469557 RepID=UPI00053D5CE1|nr:T9SS C-terminal target domain-containing protein [Lacinutrix jangbogonensis]
MSFSIPPVAGSNGSLDICEDETNTYDLFNNLGGSPDAGGTWLPTLNSTTGIFDPSIDPPGTYIYTVSTSNPACSDASASVIVSFSIPPVAGSDGSLDICEGDTNSYDLFNNLGGSPDAGGTWSPALNSTTGIFDPTIDTPGIYTYTVATSDPVCSDASASITVSFSIPPVAGSDGSLDICEDDTNTYDLFNNLGGSPDAGGTWLPTLNSNTGLFDPTIDAPGTYTYTVATSNPVCSDASASITVSFPIPPIAGDDGNLEICEDDNNTYDLFDSLGGSPDTGGTWSPALNSTTGVFDPTIDIPGTYTYSISIPECSLFDSAEVIVFFLELPNIIDLEISVNNICKGEDLTVNVINASSLENGNYVIIYNITADDSFTDSVLVEIIDGEGTFIILADVLTITGEYELTITDVISESSNCDADASLIIPITFEVYESITPILINQGNVFCINDEPTIEDLSNNIINSDDIIWYDRYEDGNVLPPNSYLIDGETYFASMMTFQNCPSINRLIVTVELTVCQDDLIIPDGFSPNGDTINDTFQIKNLKELYPNFKLTIYNRYGNKLYSGDLNTPEWDGVSNTSSRFGNSTVPAGVYFFILEFNDDNQEPLQGRVYLNM